MNNEHPHQLTLHELEKAAAENHRQLFSLNAACLGGNVRKGNGIEWTCINGNEASTVMFPSLTKENAGDELNALMENFRQQAPATAGYWSLLPAQPENVGLHLLARGWQPGWQPCWMALDTLNRTFNEVLPEGYRISEETSIGVSLVNDLPYREDSAYFSSRLLQQYPEQACRVTAWYEEKIIGHCCLFFSEGTANVAGLYNMGVVPEQRRKGIGKALLHAAAMISRKKGFRYVTLNANNIGRPLYEKVGFSFISYGATWWLMNKNYLTQSSNEIQLAEAVGSGDLETLDQLASSVPLEILAKPMCNGMRWMEFAVYVDQKEAARWLTDHGALLTGLDAWNLGWKDKAADLLREDPGEIDRRYFEWGGTLLHVAAEKNDLPLLQLALQYKPDLSIKDLHHNGTPLDWAMFFRRDEMIVLLKQVV